MQPYEKGNMAKAKENVLNPDTDNYPAWRDVLDAAIRHEDFPNGPIDRVELNCLPNGQGTWRVWAPKAQEPIGGVYLGAGYDD